MAINKFRLYWAACAALTLSTLWSSCKKDEETESEVVTTVEVHLTGPGIDKKFYWNDPDGDGGAAPAIDEIKLPPLTGNISCLVHVYDRSKNPEVDITEEIEAESNDHLFVYTISGADMEIQYADTDRNGKNFGLKTKWTTDQPSSGTLKVRLFHEPSDKNNLSAPGGEEDFNIDFPVKIQ